MQETTSESRSSVAEEHAPDASIRQLMLRSCFGGVLMGLANLVPGISGGTMLLAAGIYPKFVDAIAEVTRLKFRTRSLLVLACVGGAAVVSILLLAGTLKALVVDYRWVMYALFIGLTLGGVPIVWKLAKPLSAQVLVPAILAFLLMVGLALLQAFEVVGQGGSNFIMLTLAGLAGASAMILPGLSGGYLLLLLGQYVPILSAIDAFKEALKAGDFTAAMGPALGVMLPVGIGVLIGIAGVGNLLQWLLRKHQKATCGALLGLLIGSTVGLFPFQVGVPPQVGDTIKGQVVTAETLSEIEKEDWQTQYFAPSIPQAFGAVALVAVGFAITLGVAHLGKEE